MSFYKKLNLSNLGLTDNDIANDSNRVFYAKWIIDYRLEGTSNLFDVATAEEGASLVGVTEGAIRKAMASGRLKLGEDYRKAGRITLLNKNSLFKIVTNKNKYAIILIEGG